MNTENSALHLTIKGLQSEKLGFQQQIKTLQKEIKRLEHLRDLGFEDIRNIGENSKRKSNIIAALKEVLKGIRDMPDYDQDNEFRLRGMAKNALIKFERQN